MSDKVPVSILVPIKNEAANLARCLESVAWAGEVFVVDSQSTDGSVELAEKLGAKVVQFQFGGTWPKKKNWSLENLPFAHEWVFILDADEVLPPGTEESFARSSTARDPTLGQTGIGSTAASCSWAAGSSTPITRTGTCGCSATGWGVMKN